MKFLIFFITIFINLPDLFAGSRESEEAGIDAIIGLVLEHNHSLRAANQGLNATTQLKKSTGYLPDPMIKSNFFGSPIETRNGPQKSNIMLSQTIPWPADLRADEKLAASQESVKKDEIDLLTLDLIFKTKSILYSYVGLYQKQENKRKMQESLKYLQQVVLSRVSLGSASQADIARINIELTSLSQGIRAIDSKLAGIRHRLQALTSGQLKNLRLPVTLSPDWVRPVSDALHAQDFSNHPLLLASQAKIRSAEALLAKATSNKRPKISASLSWFQIDRPDSVMNGTSPGKDAWAVGAGITLPLFQEKYSSMERSMIARRSEADQRLRQARIDISSEFDRTLEEFKSLSEISSMYQKDILPQARQALRSDKDSYSQGRASFERVIENYLRVIRFEDLFIESQSQLATLRAQLEKIAGKNL